VSKLFWTISLSLALIILLILMFQRRILFPTHLVPHFGPDHRSPAGIEQIWLGQPDHKVEAWLLRSKNHPTESEQSIVLFFHGNAELIDDLPSHVRTYLTAGVSVALMEYRGYGRSTGSPSQSRLVKDAVELRDGLIQVYGFGSDQFFYHGRSLGGGVAAGLALLHTPKGLILESTFSSVKAIAADMLIPGFLVLDPFDSESVLKKLDCPVLILHGRSDTVVPVGHSQRLADAAKDVVLQLFDAGHNDLSLHAESYWRAILKFVKR